MKCLTIIRRGLFCVALVCLAASCATHRGPVPEEPEVGSTVLPRSVGADPFRGNTYTTSTERLEFHDDGTMTISGFDEATGGFTRDSMAAYTYNTERQEIYVRTVRIYSEDGEYDDARQLADLLFDAQEEAYIQAMDSAYIDDESRENYMSLMRDMLEANARQLFETVMAKGYSLGTEGDDTVLVLKDLARENLAAADVDFGVTADEAYSVVLESGFLMITDLAVTTDTVTSYYIGITDFDEKNLVVECPLYWLYSVYDQDTGAVTLRLTRPGTLRAAYRTQVDADTERADVCAVTHTMAFTACPPGLEKLREVSVTYPRQLGSSAGYVRVAAE